VNITISIPVRAIAQTVAKPFVAVAHFVSTEAGAVAAFLAARARALAAFAASGATSIARGASAVASHIAPTAKTIVAATRGGIVTAAAATWTGIKVGTMFAANLAGNLVNAVMGPLAAWWVGNTANLMGVTWLGIGLHWFAVVALVGAVVVGIAVTIDATQAWTRRKAAIQAQAVAASAPYQHSEPVPADAPDPEGNVSQGIHQNNDELNDEAEAAEKANFALHVQASLDALEPEHIMVAAEAIGAAFFDGLPMGDSADYKEARRQFRLWMQTNKSLNSRVPQALRGFDKARAARLSQTVLVSV